MPPPSPTEPMACKAMPNQVWLLNGADAPISALLTTLSGQQPGLAWQSPNQPPVDAQAVAQHVLAGGLKLVLLVGEQAKPSCAEDRWRQWLQANDLPHAVLPLDWRLTSPMTTATRVARLLASVTRTPSATAPEAGTGTWRHWGHCDDCSDPACEQHLFMALLARRSVQT